MPKTKYKRKAPVKKKSKYEDLPKWTKSKHWQINVKGKQYNVPKASEVGNAILGGVMGVLGKKGAKKATKKKAAKKKK